MVYRAALHELFELMECGLFASGGDRALTADGSGMYGRMGRMIGAARGRDGAVLYVCFVKT